MTDFILCGNPGTGKSTILNAVCADGHQFKSGPTGGQGLTSELKFYPSDPNAECRYADTPGLDDMALKKQAAKAIEKALKDAAVNERKVVIIFVITAEAGRIRPADVATIQTVMGSFRGPDGERAPNNKFNVIINKFDKSWYDRPKFQNSVKGQMEFFLKDPSDDKFATNNIFYIFNDPDLAYEDNAAFSMDAKKQLFKIFAIAQNLTIGYDSTTGKALVDPIDTEKYDAEAKKLVEQMKKELEDMKKEKDEMMRKLEESERQPTVDADTARPKNLVFLDLVGALIPGLKLFNDVMTNINEIRK